jgi:hypothetical protein
MTSRTDVLSLELGLARHWILFWKPRAKECVGFMVYEPLANMKLSPMQKRTESGFRQAQVSILGIIGRLSSGDT